MNFNPSDIAAVAPEIAILVLAMAVITVELLKVRGDALLQWLTIGGLLGVMTVVVLTIGNPGGAFNGMVAHDGVAAIMKLLVCGVALLAALMSGEYLNSGGVDRGGSTPYEDGDPTPDNPTPGSIGIRHGEYYGMLLLATFGMMVLASATDLVTIFLGIETMSIALYVLAGIRADKPRSSEAALKYFLLGAFFTGFLLYGMALIYGTTGGNTNLAEIASAIGRMTGDLPVWLYIGCGLVMVGLLFKVAAVPFHFWSPDVYEGAPTPITAFMSAGPKAAAFIAFVRLFGWGLPDLSHLWGPSLWVVAAATMTVGNIIAIAQKDVKRMLAYSSIAHAGYLCVAVIAAASYDVRSDAIAGMMFYLTGYYLMNLGAFTVAMMVARGSEDRDYSLENYKGLAASSPWAAAAMALFMVSLAGIPPTAGFFGKLYVFSAAVNADLVVLVVIGVLCSALSVFYYLRIVVYMYMQPATETVRFRLSPALAVVLIVCSLGIVKLGLMPDSLMRWTKHSAEEIARPHPQLASEASEALFAATEEVE